MARGPSGIGTSRRSPVVFRIVQMVIHEPRDDCAPGQIDHPSGRSSRPSNRSCRAHGGETALGHRNHLGSGIACVEGDNPACLENCLWRDAIGLTQQWRGQNSSHDEA